MKVAIVGAGIVGVTTAYELAASGHEVTVFERRGAAAEETSFANAGMVAPGYVTPWAAPGMPAKVLRELWRPHGAVRLGWPLAWHELRWIAAWWRACKPQVHAANRERLQRLAFYSRDRLHALSTGLRLDYDCSPGVLVLMRSDKDRQRVMAGAPLLQAAGVRFEELTPQQARLVEPALAPARDFAGALHLPDDGVANCRQFALLLKKEAQALGAQFEFHSTVKPLDRGSPAVLRVARGGDPPTTRAFDAVVLCGGVDAADLLRPVGVRLPLAAVHGYSVSAPIAEPLNAPRSGVMDERYKVAITRLGQRVRVAGSAQIGGRADQKRPDVIRTLYKVLQDWFPASARLTGQMQQWKGARAMLPDGPPVLGASGIPGVWLNLGHGSSGWALSCGSARALADLVSGRTPEIDLEGLDLGRLGL